MSRIETYENWCHIDRLDGVELKDKEYIRLKWPDGNIAVYQIEVKRRSYVERDHGHDCNIPVSEAYCVVSVHGAPAYVRLAGMEAERV